MTNYEGLKAEQDVGGDDNVVRRVQILAVVAVGDDGDRAVELGTRDPPGAVRYLLFSDIPNNRIMRPAGK
jgi:hypothetical protein